MLEMSNCLIVVDVQNGFMSEHTKHIVKRIESLLEQGIFDHTIFTKYYNPEDSPMRKIMNWHGMSDEEDQDLVDPLKKYSEIIIEKCVYGANDELKKFIREN